MHTHELTLSLAFGLGALHALKPGHGKTAMLLYLAGERRSLLHPLVMGLSSALSHSLSLIRIAAMVHMTHAMDKRWTCSRCWALDGVGCVESQASQMRLQ